MGLSARQRLTVEALGDTLFPSLGDGDPSGSEILPDRVDAFVDQLAPDQRKGLSLALTLFDLGALATRARRFYNLKPAAREAYVRACMTSRLAPRKLIYRGLRDTLALLYYQDDRTWPAIGYAGPKVDRGDAHV
jgi:hypothetical protein